MTNSEYVDPIELRIREALDKVLPNAYESIENFGKLFTGNSY